MYFIQSGTYKGVFTSCKLVLLTIRTIGPIIGLRMIEIIEKRKYGKQYVDLYKVQELYVLSMFCRIAFVSGNVYIHFFLMNILLSGPKCIKQSDWLILVNQVWRYN